MPKPTFDNLASDKRQRIVEAAIGEFSRHPYSRASLSRICSEAGIPKGSMYQYFANKLDLYRWLLFDEAYRRKKEVLDRAMTQGDGDFFEHLESMVHAALAFWVAHPRLSRVGHELADVSPDPELRELWLEARRLGLANMEALVARGQAEGDIREDINPSIAAHFLASVLHHTVTEVILARLNLTLGELLENPELAASLSASEQRQLVHAIVELIRCGVGRQTPTDNEQDPNNRR